MRPKTLQIASLIVGAIGLALLVMMILVESEPGAIPLALLLLGVVGYTVGRIRSSKR